MADEQTEDSIEALLGSGIFERHWYMAQCGVYFHNSRTAAEHFVQVGMALEASPHPLMEPRVWPEHLRRGWKAGNFGPVMNWFRKPKLDQPPMGPLFEARYFDVPDALFVQHPGGLLGYFLEHSDEDAVLPTRFGDIGFEPVRNSWPGLYTRLKAHNRLVGTRNVYGWNAVREREWIEALPPLGDTAAPIRVSVIMPTWNRAHVVARSIRSVQSQTHGDWELIVVDDGSTDSTREVIRAMAVTDARIRLVEAVHGGVSAARNAGLDAATGDYVAFLDSDNEWPTRYLDLMLRGVISSGASAGYAGLQLHDGDKTMYRAYEGDIDHLMIVNHIDLNVLVVDRQLAIETRFDDSLRRWVDHDFAIRVGKTTRLHMFPFIGCVYDDDRGAATRITTMESDAWQWVVLGKNLVEWHAVPDAQVARGRVSVVIPIYQDWRMTVRAALAVLENSGEHDIEVILVDNGSAYHYGAAIAQFFAGEARVRYERLPRNMNFAIGSNFGAASGTGEYICFLNNDTEVRDGWLDPLLARIQDPKVRGVQPLLQYPDDSIQTAGTVFLAPRTPPTHFLSKLPPEDASSVGELEFSAVTAACVLIRRSELAELGGFDPIFVNGMEDVDLCLRAIEKFGGHFAVDPTSRVTHHESKTPGRGRQIPENRKFFMERWKDRFPEPDTAKFNKVGFEVAGVGGDKLWLTQPRPLIVRSRVDDRSRWGIRYSAIGGTRGDRWGDTFYAESLAAALSSPERKIVTYRHGANAETDRSYDDVNLVIRGLDKVTPIPDQVNVLWVISHPEDVTVEELRAFDLVYASSGAWARTMSAAAGVEVRPLLQATDASIFHPPVDGEMLERRPVTFVGGHFPHRVRQVVADSLVSGIDMRVIGHGWKNLPRSIFEAERVENSALGGVYRGAHRILADHWPDMAEMGFIQNRIFDAVACGVPVISDHVEGIDDLFGSLVQVYNDVDHLRFLASDAAESTFGTAEERLAQARQILRDHSFTSRAKTLVKDVKVVRERLFGC